MSTYFDEINNAISTTVIDGVLNYFESQGLDISSVTPEDIAKHLGTQYVPRGKAVSNAYSVIPAAKRVAANGAVCDYMFTRGTKSEKGEPCGKAANGDSYDDHPRCKAHSGKAGKLEGAPAKSKVSAKPVVKPGAPKAPAARPPPPSAAPRRDTSRQTLRPVPNGDGLMYDPKTMVVVDNSRKEVVGVLTDGVVKNYLTADQRKDFSLTNFKIPDDLPETEPEDDITFDDEPEAVEEEQEVHEEEQEAVDEADAPEEQEPEPEPEPAPVRRPAAPGALKRPMAPGGVKRPAGN